MTNRYSLKQLIAATSIAFVTSIAISPVVTATETKDEKATTSSGATGVDMQGNVVELGNFRFGGDDMAKYADGKMGTGEKDPAVCGSFSSAKCSVGHLQDK